MTAIVRHFAAVQDGVVVASCSTLHRRAYAVIDTHGVCIWRATPHGAVWQADHMDDARILLARETSERLTVGECFNDDDAPHERVDVTFLERIYELDPPPPTS